jgi:hypothetical protein
MPKAKSKVLKAIENIRRDLTRPIIPYYFYGK